MIFLPTKNKLRIFLLTISAFLVFAGLILNYTEKSSVEIVVIAGEEFFLEDVYSNKDLSKGLGGRSDLCRRCGMRFIFPEKGVHVFWMKGMLFPLDIIWLEGDKIVWIEKNVPPDSLNKMGGNIDSDSVIEVNSGVADSLELKIGNMVKF